MTERPAQSPTLPAAAVEMLWKGNVVEAIKLVRVERNFCLKDAKDLVDDTVSAPGYCSAKIYEGGCPPWQCRPEPAPREGTEGFAGARRLGSQDS